MKETLKYTIGIIITLAVGWFVGYLSPRTGKTNDGRSDTTTVITYDTVRIYQPIAEKSSVIGSYKFATVPTLLSITDTVKTPYYVHDTLIIPIEQRYYAGESYKAWVSGYNPKLDSLQIYQQTKIVTIDKIKEARNHLYISSQLNYYTLPAMSVELQAGYTRDRLTYYIGAGAVTDGTFRFYGVAGLRYTILTKKW